MRWLALTLVLVGCAPVAPPSADSSQGVEGVFVAWGVRDGGVPYSLQRAAWLQATECVGWRYPAAHTIGWRTADSLTVLGDGRRVRAVASFGEDGRPVIHTTTHSLETLAHEVMHHLLWDREPAVPTVRHHTHPAFLRCDPLTPWR